MVKINRKITQINRTVRNGKSNRWIVIHYVGAESTAYNNARYFEKEYRGASAHYFVDENSIWQVVEDKDNAWHVGGAKIYYNEARNDNSIGIEMCCKKVDGKWYIEPKTIQNTVELTKMLMARYSIPIQRVTTHYLTTHKICPEPFVRNPALWTKFLEEVCKVEEVIEDGETALEYLVAKKRISDKEYWSKALDVTRNLNYLFMKWANDVKNLEAGNERNI